MGSGKTTLLHHLFGMAPPCLYTSTGVAEQSLRGFLHHIVLKSAGAWKRLSYEHIQEVLALLIKAGMKEADVHSLASVLKRSIDQDNPVPVPATAFPLPPVPKESHTSKKIVPLIARPPSYSKLVSPSKDLILELVHMIDTGGQPELMEVMPSLIHNADIAVVLINLEYGLDECPKISYHDRGVGYECQLSSNYTARDIILKLASTLHAKKSLHQTFHILIVATHRDCVKENFEAQIESLNTELHSLLYPAFKDELILSKAPRQIPFVLNLKNPEDCDMKALNKIRTDMGKPRLGITFDTPTSFFVFEQDLVQFANNTVKRQILSLAECKQVGTRLKMSDEMVEAALILFHRQNTFLYFRHVLPNHIFVNPQVPLDIVNGIVRYRYKMNAGELETLIPDEFVTQLNQGIITEELLGYDKISSHFEKGFYEVQDVIKLFCHTFTLAPLQPDNPETVTPVDDKQKQYLMMSLMPDKKLNDYIPNSSDTVPLVIKFSSGCVPLGCFGSTIACLLSKYGWEVIWKDGSPKCLAHNIASLHDPELLVNIVLVDFSKYLEIRIKSDLSTDDSPADICSQVRSKVLGAIENVFEIMHLSKDKLTISSAVICSCRDTSESHFAVFVNRKEKYFLCCEYSKCRNTPNEKQLLWMYGSAHTSEGMPSTSQKYHQMPDHEIHRRPLPYEYPHQNHPTHHLPRHYNMQPPHQPQPFLTQQSTLSQAPYPHQLPPGQVPYQYQPSQLPYHPQTQAPYHYPPPSQPLEPFPSHQATQSQELPQKPTLPLSHRPSVVRPQLSDLAQELKELAWSDVQDMAIRLGLGFVTLQNIEHQYPTPSNRLSAAMQAWLDSDCHASWKKIVKALEDIGKAVLAKQIRDRKLSNV